MNPESSNDLVPKENGPLDQLQKPSEENKLPKIRGALILVAVVMIFNLFQNLSYFLGSMAPFMRSSRWELFTNPNSPKFHPQWKLVLIFDALTATLILFWNIAALVFFFRKKRGFPRLIAVSIPIIFLLILAGHFLSGLIPAVAGSAVYAKEETALIMKFIGLHIWIPYFLLSKRVAKTFVR